MRGGCQLERLTSAAAVVAAALSLSAMLLATSLGLTLATPAHAKRVALVVGNGKYTHTRALPNPPNDAVAIAETLRALGFDTTVKLDLGYRAMRTAIRDFGRAAQGAEIALVHFAGHGLEVGGENWLLPVDAQVLRDGDLEYEAVPLPSMLAAVRGAGRLGMVILDACRNNPLGERIRLSSGVTRSVSRGLGRIEPTGEVLVAYAAKAGTLARDGKGKLSPFASALVAHLPTPELDIRIVMGRVRDAVLASTGRAQEPFTYGSIGGREVVLKPGLAALVVSTPAPSPGPSSPSGASEVVRLCREVSGIESVGVLEAMARQHVGTPAGDCISARLGELKRAAEAERQRVVLLERQRREEAAKDPAAGVRPGSGRSFRDCATCPAMVVVPAGTFRMGSPEGPVRTVRIGGPFAVGKFEVTFAEWDACRADGGCSHNPNDHGWGRGRQPVITVSWDDAQQYVAWLSGKTGKSYRLLTEAEWEYATRAGTTTPFWWGRSISTAQANYDGNHTYAGGSKGEYRGRTVPVDSFRPNPWGLYNVHGNAWEWVEDCYADSYRGAPVDGSARTTGDCSHHVVRGGSWISGPQYLRAANRSRDSPDVRYGIFGFRVARSLSR